MPVNRFGGQSLQPAMSQFKYYDLNVTGDLTLVWPFSFLASNDVVANNMYFVGPVATVTLPDATQASPGTSFIFNNIGANTVFVNNGEGAPLDSVASGSTYYFCLSDNTTVGGLWLQTALGANTQTPTANALAGYGLISIPGPNLPYLDELNTEVVTTTQTTNYSIQSSDRASLIVVPAGSALTAVDLGTNIGDFLDGYYFYIANQNSFPFSVEPGAGTINSNTAGVPLTVYPGESYQIICISTASQAWASLGGTVSGQGSFQIVDFDLSGASPTVTLTPDTYNKQVINFTGTLGQQTFVYFPAVDQEWIVENNTDGAFELYLQMTDGAGGGVGNARVVPLLSQMNYFTDISVPDLYRLPDGLLVSQGGTSASTPTGAFNNLSPIATQNELITCDGIDNVAIAAPTLGQVLTVVPDVSASLDWYGVSTLFFAPLTTDTILTGLSQTVTGALGVKIASDSLMIVEGSICWGAQTNTVVTVTLSRVLPTPTVLYTVSVFPSASDACMYSTPFYFVDNLPNPEASVQYSVTVSASSTIYINRSYDGTALGSSSLWMTEIFSNA